MLAVESLHLLKQVLKVTRVRNKLVASNCHPLIAIPVALFAYPGHFLNSVLWRSFHSGHATGRNSPQEGQDLRVLRVAGCTELKQGSHVANSLPAEHTLRPVQDHKCLFRVIRSFWLWNRSLR